MSYSKTVWTNSSGQPISASNLNHIEQGLYEAHVGLGGDVHVKQYGAVGDGTTDDSAAIQAAETYRQSINGVLRFSPGTYKITTQIDVGDRCAWRGVRSERGANAAGVSAAYSTVRINWRPTSGATYLFDESSVGRALIGPYVFEDITFDWGTANGVRFGEDLGGEGDYCFGVRFSRCAHTAPALTAATGSTLTRTGRRMLHLEKHFETVVEDSSFWGGDVHIYSKGGDMPEFYRCRSQYAAIPLECRGGLSDAPGIVNGMQIERWHLCAMLFEDQWVRVTDCRWENVNDTGQGRFAMSETFAVTSGSGTLTASATMTNKLFAGVSILEITDGANIDTVLVDAVSGTSVTVNTDGFAFDWTAGAATATRIHGHGILSSGGSHVAIQGGSPGAAPDTPAIIYTVGSGQMSMSGVLTAPGVFGDFRAKVIGNRYIGQPYLNAALYVDGCSPLISPNPAHPFVRVTSHRAQNGGWNYSGNYRQTLADLAEEEALFRRQWAFTPKSAANANQNAHLAIMRLISAATDTAEQVAVWSLPASTHYLFDRTLPTSGYLKITVRARAKTTSGTLTVGALGVGGTTSPLFTATVGTTWQTLTQYVVVPATQWTTSRTASTDVAVSVAHGQAFYLAGVLIEELLGPFDAAGTGTPEGVVPAPVGSSYKRSDGVDGTPGTLFYRKATGTSNTGWVAK